MFTCSLLNHIILKCVRAQFYGFFLLCQSSSVWFIHIELGILLKHKSAGKSLWFNAIHALCQYVCVNGFFVLPMHHVISPHKKRVRSTMTRCVVAVDWMNMSGPRDVWTISGNCSFLSLSACSVRSLACCMVHWFAVLLVGIFASHYILNK